MTRRTIVGADATEAGIDTVARGILGAVAELEQLVLVGIRRGGVPLAERLARRIARERGVHIAVGAVDIGLYRDDTNERLPTSIEPTVLPVDIDGRDVVLVDDVLYTGRTVRAAIDHVLDYGRPRRIWLAALCDRGGRELPIAPDWVGLKANAASSETIEVVISDDGKVRVDAVPRKGGT